MLFLFMQIHKLSSKARLRKYASIVVYGAFTDNSLRIIMRNILLNRSLSLVDKLACLYFYVASFRTLLFAGTKLWFARAKLSFAGTKLWFARAKLSFAGNKQWFVVAKQSTLRFECDLIRREQRKQEPLRFIHRGGAHSKITL